MLESLGMTDVALWPQSGAWRTDKRLDVYSFEGHATLPADERGYRRPVSLCSWSTMGDIVRSRGVVAEPDDVASVELHPSPDGRSVLEPRRT